MSMQDSFSILSLMVSSVQLLLGIGGLVFALYTYKKQKQFEQSNILRGYLKGTIRELKNVLNLESDGITSASASVEITNEIKKLFDPNVQLEEIFKTFSNVHKISLPVAVSGWKNSVFAIKLDEALSKLQMESSGLYGDLEIIELGTELLIRILKIGYSPIAFNTILGSQEEMNKFIEEQKKVNNVSYFWTNLTNWLIDSHLSLYIGRYQRSDQYILEFIDLSVQELVNLSDRSIINLSKKKRLYESTIDTYTQEMNTILLNLKNHMPNMLHNKLSKILDDVEKNLGNRRENNIRDKF